MTFGPLSPPIATLHSFAARHRKALEAYALLALALWPVSLLGRVHAEASAVVAVAAYFVSGLAAWGAFRGNAKDGRASFARQLAAQEALLIVPLVLLTATAIWRPQCAYAQGLLLFAAMPPVTVAFAVAGAYALAAWGVRWGKATLVLAGVGIGIGGPLWDLGVHPQFYTYNPLFGGVLGPIYDRELALRPGFFAARALASLWALLFFLAGRWGEQRGGERPFRHLPFPVYPATVTAVVLVIGGAYANAARLGLNTPAGFIQEALGGHRRTAHFDIYYDPEALSESEVERLAEDHEWHYRRLQERLGAAPKERIASYLYPSEDVKARLTGARETSVSPVWLERPQVHLLRSAYGRSFGHELVHVFSRTFGMPVLNASPAVGLVEGLAVAFEPPQGRPPPADQVAAAALMAANDRLGGASLAEGVAARFSPFGFWVGRGAVSYTTMGAFVRFLARRYGPRKLRAVYAWANFEEVYGKSARALAEEWEQALGSRRSVALSAGPLAATRFSQPSLFEEECPHYVPPHVRAYRRGREALDGDDTTAARAAFREALAEKPAFEAARVRLARLRLEGKGGKQARTPRRRAMRALRLLRAAPDSNAHGRSFHTAWADAQAMRGRPAAARQRYDRALAQLLPYRHAARARLLLRRALAGRPRLIAAVASAGASQEKTRRLRRRANEDGTLPPAAAVLRAALLAEEKQYRPAARVLAAVPPVDVLPSESARGEVRRQRLAWRAQWTYRAGRPGRAARLGRRVADAYRAFGDRDEAARWKAFAAKMQWVAR
jgi:hypothetical protein